MYLGLGFFEGIDSSDVLGRQGGHWAQFDDMNEGFIMVLTVMAWSTYQPPLQTYSLKNKALVAGVVKGNQWFS